MPSEQQLARYEQRAKLGEDFLLSVLGSGAPLPKPPYDLSLLFKPACLFATCGHLREAHQILDRLMEFHRTPEGDFLADGENKATDVPYLNQFWTYPNGWIAMAAHKLGRFGLSFDSYRFMFGQVDPETGGAFNVPEGKGPRYLDVISTAHTGHVALYLGDIATARRCGEALQMFFENQPERDHLFHLRFHADGSPVQEFPHDDRPFFVIDTAKPDLFYFMLGYPLALLSMCFLTLKDDCYLANARRYFELLENCPGVQEQLYSHKVAWGSALYFQASHDTEAAVMAERILDHLVSQQDDAGRILGDQPPHVCWDQTAEVAYWLRVTASLLRECC